MDPDLVERAVALAGTIPDDQKRAEALAGIAEDLAGADPGDPALLDRPLAVAQTIPLDWIRSNVIARIHARNRSGLLDELSCWRLRPLGTSIDLVNVFLGNSHDKAVAEKISLALLEVAREFPAGN